jgi:hypothetical protein
MIKEVEFEQYLLISFMESIRNTVSQKYDNLITISGDKPEYVFNKILNCDKDVYKFWANLSPLQKAALVPRVNLFYFDRIAKKYLPVMFRNTPNFSYLSNFATAKIDEVSLSNQKEDGAGIKQITIINKNEKPSDVNIEAKIELFFDGELALYNSNLLGLIKTPPVRTLDNSIDYRIKLVVGWAAPVDGTRKVFSKEDIQMIEKSNSVYLLEIVTHSIEVASNGSLKITIHYQGALEKYLSISSKADIFSLLPKDYRRLAGTAFSTGLRESITKEQAASTSGTNRQVGTYGRIVQDTKEYYVTYLMEKIRLETLIAALSYKEQDETDKRFESEEAKEKNTEKEEVVSEKIKKIQEELEQINIMINKMEMYVVKEKHRKILDKVIEDKTLYSFSIKQELLTEVFNEISNSTNTLPNVLDKIKDNFLVTEVNTNNQNPFDVISIRDQVNAINQVKNDLSLSGGERDLKYKSAKSMIESSVGASLSDEQIEKIVTMWNADISEDVSEEDIAERIKEIQLNIIRSEKEIANVRNAGGGYQQDSQVAKTLPLDETGGPELDFLRSYKNIAFITLGDIINAAASLIDFEDEVKVILGPIKINNIIYNIADIPISFKLFNIWFAENVIKQNKRSWFFWQFIQDIFKNLVHNNLINNPIFGKVGPNLNVQVTSIVSESKLENGKHYNINDQGVSDTVFNSLSPNVWSYADVYMYLVIYAYDYEIEKRHGDFNEDVGDGIYHYYRGTDRGIIKNINFSKIDFPRFRDMRIANGRYNEIGDILREHYNATLDCIGCPLFAIGSHIYLNATSIGKYGIDISKKLGLSGYYLITSIEKIFTPDKYEEKLNTFWVFSELGTSKGVLLER